MTPKPTITAALTAELAATGMIDSTLARIALRLAQTLDDGAGMATAAVSKELRATLDALKAGGDDDGDLDRFLDGLRTPVRDTPPN